MAAAAQEQAQRRRKGAAGLGEGKGATEAAGERQCAGVRAGTVAPAAGLGARAVGGAEAGTARRPPASAAPPPLPTASGGGLTGFLFRR